MYLVTNITIFVKWTTINNGQLSIKTQSLLHILKENQVALLKNRKIASFALLLFVVPGLFSAEVHCLRIKVSTKSLLFFSWPLK